MAMEITPEILDKLEKIQEKYAAIGEDFNAYLEGLLYADSVKYWDYIELDTLLSLQKPRTNIPDEHIFIIYHQITELYFQLALKEFEQLADHKEMNESFFIERVSRINRYWQQYQLRAHVSTNHLTGNFVILRTWTAMDECGNTATCVQTITVQDIITPVITCPVDLAVSYTDMTPPTNTDSATSTKTVRTCAWIRPIRPLMSATRPWRSL